MAPGVTTDRAHPCVGVNSVWRCYTLDRAAKTVRASPIQTLTVGSGISPDQPSAPWLLPAGCVRVADYNRRFGITPTPEHVMLHDDPDDCRNHFHYGTHLPFRATCCGATRLSGEPAGPWHAAMRWRPTATVYRTRLNRPQRYSPRPRRRG